MLSEARGAELASDRFTPERELFVGRLAIYRTIAQRGGSMELVRGRMDQPSGLPTKTFTGQVYSDRLLDIEGVLRMGNVLFFSPGARTYWHSHDDGQILKVVSGQGRVASGGEPMHLIRAGDIVWTPPGELHWHGADSDSCLVHMTISLGATQWGAEVSAEEYDAAKPGVPGIGPDAR